MSQIASANTTTVQGLGRNLTINSGPSGLEDATLPLIYGPARAHAHCTIEAYAVDQLKKWKVEKWKVDEVR
jgi:hypothetical protein